MLERRIRKFEIGRRQVFNITYEKDNENTGGCDTLQLKCSEYPRPALIEAVKELSPYIAEILELPDYCEDRLIAKKLAYTYNEKTAEIGVTINYETPTSEIPFTPECSKIIEQLTTEIFRYIDGDRAQGKLNFDDNKEA